MSNKRIPSLQVLIQMALGTSFAKPNTLSMNADQCLFIQQLNHPEILSG